MARKAINGMAISHQRNNGVINGSNKLSMVENGVMKMAIVM